MPTKKTRIPKERTENADQMAQALAPIHERLDVHAEMLKRIIQLLTEEKASDEPSLYKLLADLITRIDGQSRYLMELTVAVGKLGHEPAARLGAGDRRQPRRRPPGRRACERGGPGMMTFRKLAAQRPQAG